MTRHLPQGLHLAVHQGRIVFEYQWLIVTEGGRKHSSLTVGSIANRHYKAVKSTLVLLQ
jgi:hypothetical protein